MVKLSTHGYPVIYVYRIDDEKHKDLLKVGMTSIEAESAYIFEPDCEELRKRAIERINQQTGTASIDYELLYTEVAVFKMGGKDHEFEDSDVRKVLANSNYANAELTNNNGAVALEWVKVNDVEIVKKAITAVKEGRASLDLNDFKKIDNTLTEGIKFREEQEEAISDTITRFGIGKKMLWNAKMRFGKTLCALEVIKRKQYRRTLIITHRPSVRSGWFEDFIHLGFDDDYYFGHKKVAMPKLSIDDTEEDKKIYELIQTRVKKFEVLEEKAKSKEMRYIFFASIQDLRGSWDKKTGKYKKNKEIFEAKWDLLIVDEAHEGTKTELGESVIAKLQKNDTLRTLYLSGTPYNILDNFEPEEVYSWTYEMEQEAKQRWYENHPGEPNPYKDLPRLEMHTYKIDEVFDYGRDEENDFFNFAEFFRVIKERETDEFGNEQLVPTTTFVHEKDVKDFLNLMCDGSKETNYPYSTEAYRFSFSHTLWVLPGVAEAAALSKLIREHEILKQYYVINVAGEGDDDQDNSDSVKKVKDNIAAHDKTITLTCGRLTTGVSIPEWSAVFMLCGGSKISAAFYLQTIFRAQTPTKRHVFPKKEVCYAFDFAPDRSIEVANEYVDQQRRSSRRQPPIAREKSIETTLNFLPIIAHEGSQELPYDTITFMKNVGDAYKEHIKRRGFRDRRLFVNLAKLTEEQYRAIGEIGLKMSKGGHTFGTSNSDSGIIELASTGLDGSKAEKKKEGKKEKKKKVVNGTSSGGKKPIDKSKEAFKVLGDIYTRLPMLIFGCDLKDTDITLQRIMDEVDETSWAIFMPNGVGKPEMQQLMDLNILIEDRFAAAASDIPAEIKAADSLPITERVKVIAGMIARFRFPDKETVLTPWRVVNMHLSDTIGGYDFYDENHTKEIAEPRFVSQDGIADKVFRPDARILEINSKSGLYPLYVAYSLYRQRIKFGQTEMFAPDVETDEGKLYVWDQVLSENLYVLCMSEMAAKITHRVLAGYRNVKTNVRPYLKGRNLVEDIKNKTELPNVVARIKGKNNFWGNNNTDMNFDAIVGNPPYQSVNQGVGNGADPLYHLFIDLAMCLGETSTLIHPGRFLFNAGKTPKGWNNSILNNPKVKVVRYWANSTDVFPTVDIKGGVAVTFYDKKADFGCIGFFSTHEELPTILSKVKVKGQAAISSIVGSRELYRLTDTLYQENPQMNGRQSVGHKYSLGANIFDVFPEIFSDICSENENEMAEIYGRANNRRCFKWIKRSYLNQPDNFEKYKVIITKANGTGALGEVLSTPIVVTPNVAYTDTFIGIGAFDTEVEANACLKYLHTKFARTMLGTLKITQDNPRETWANVPMQDFTSKSDINWDVSISEIDKQLYAKYQLSEKEILFIEQKIRPMG